MKNKKVFKGIHLKKLHEDEGKILAVFATLDVIDKDGDVIKAGAIGEQTAAFLHSHVWGMIPLGKVRTFEQGNEALAEITLNLELQTAKDLLSALKFDQANGEPIQEFSFGFFIRESEDGEVEGKRVRILKKLDVPEVSTVLRGAGENTRVVSVKSIKLAEGGKIDGSCISLEHEKDGGCSLVIPNELMEKSGFAKKDLQKKPGPAKVTLKDQAAQALASSQELVDRVKSLAELRAKDGRKLSSDNVDALAQLQKGIETLQTSIAGILKKSEPDPKEADDAARVLAESQATLAKVAGHIQAEA